MRTRQVCAAYLAMVSLIDHQVGEFSRFWKKPVSCLWLSSCPIMGECLGIMESISGPHFYDCQLQFL